MKLPELAEQLDRLVGGGIATDEGVLDSSYLYSIIHDARAFILRQDFIKFRRWSPQSLQNHYPEYESTFQDSLCYTRFELPTGFIQANQASDGLVYCGTGGDKILKIKNFRRIKSRNELADFLKNSHMSPANGRYIGVLIEGLIMTLVSRDTIKKPLVIAVWDNPTLIPTYNLQLSDYPISGDMIKFMETYIQQSTLNQISARQPDTLSDSNDGAPTLKNTNWKLRH